jgi:hypothetical protein
MCAREDGSVVAELVLPVRKGDSVVQVYRFPVDEEEFRHEGKLTWQTAGAVPSELDGRPVPEHKTSFGSTQWGFFSPSGMVLPRTRKFEHWSSSGL